MSDTIDLGTARNPIVIYVRGHTAAEKRKIAVDRRRFLYELGRLVQVWGNLQEHLAGIFSQATECPPLVANEMWHSIKSDLVQRQQLLSALKARIKLSEILKADATRQERAIAFREYVWVIEKMNALSHQRNDLIHSPLVFYFAHDATEFEAKVSDSHGNPRARTLKDKELYQLCRWLVASCEQLRKHLSSVGGSIRRTGKPPTRPKFQPMSDFPTRKQRPGARRRKSFGYRRSGPRNPAD